MEYVAKAQLPGDYVEAGVFQGQSAEWAAQGMCEYGLMQSGRTMQPHRSMHMWLYDAWQGLPEVRAEDGPGAKAWVGQMSVADPITSISRRLRNNTCVSHETLHDQVHFRQGWFNQTFALPGGPEQVAFLHIDGDWYDSVLACLERFYPLVVHGGVVVVDDFGFWEGARLAFYDYAYKNHLYPLVERTGTSQMWFIKGKEHNRWGTHIRAPGTSARTHHHHHHH